MRLGHWVMVFVLAWLRAPASAEPYRNVGGEGEVRQMTDLGLVLAWQQVGAYNKAQPEEDVTAKTEGKGDDAGSPSQDSKEIAAPSEKEILPAEGKLGPRAKDLEETRRWLQKEYQALMEIQEEIHRAQKRRKGTSALKKLDEKIKKYSKRLGEYEKKGQEYDEELEVFNALREEEIDRLPLPQAHVEDIGRSARALLDAGTAGVTDILINISCFLPDPER